jgi:HK97 family phage portal protein
MAIETLADLVLTRGGYDMSAPERRSNTLADPDEWLVNAFGGGYKSSSGETVTPRSAVNFGAVQGAFRFLSEVEASLPCHLYRRRPDGRGKDRATEHYLYSLLHDAPNDEMTAFQFWQYMRLNRASWGNGFSLPKFSGTGRWTEFWPLRPDAMSVDRNANGVKIFSYDIGDAGSAMGGVKLSGRYTADEIIHVRGMGDDLLGWSPIRLLREGIGVGMAAQRATGAFYKNGAKHSGILEVQGKVKPSDEETFNDKYAGAQNTGKVLVIGNGNKFTPTTIPPDDAQFLETVKDASRLVWMALGVPPFLMGDTEKSTSWGTGIEQQVIGLQKFTIRPSLEMTQQAFERVLLGPGEREMFIEFDLMGLLQADAKTQAEVLHIERQDGIISADDWRAFKNYNPIGGEEGEALLVNSTMIPVKTALAKPAEPTQPQQ